MSTNEESLEIIQYEQVRGVFPVKKKDGSKVEKLIASKNSIVMLHVRFPGGEPFIVTVDEETFHSEVAPHLAVKGGPLSEPLLEVAPTV